MIRRVAIKAPARLAKDISPVATVMTTKDPLDSPNARNTRKPPKQTALTTRSGNFKGDKLARQHFSMSSFVMARSPCLGRPES